MEAEFPGQTSGQEVVKVVLVGDNGVGKTRLVCARAYLQSVPLAQLVKTHVPTIWAIDQYRIYKDVLEKSNMTVDQTDVSIRLWDTFGDHHKDRRFAYEKSDVILMCFDTSRIETLQNCRTFWHQQIQKFCPDTPILLVACKNDLRYLYADQEYVQHCTARKPFVRQVFEKDIIFPHEGRYLARELGASYYETSVYTFYGVEELFENAVRAALCSRRTKRFWKTNLKSVCRPLMQEPFCPPRPNLPEETVASSEYARDLNVLFSDSRHADLIFVCSDGRGVSAHRFLLSARCPALRTLLSLDLSEDQAVHPSPSDSLLHLKTTGSSTVSHSHSLEFNLQSFLAPGSTLREDRESLYRQSRESRQARQGRPHQVTLGPGVFRQLRHHPAFLSLHLQDCLEEDEQGGVSSSLQTVVQCRHLVRMEGLEALLRFLYTGIVSLHSDHLQHLLQLARILELSCLSDYLSEQPHLGHIHHSLTSPLTIASQLETFSEGETTLQTFPDVTFQLEDGLLHSHRALLVARSDVMAAMFSDNFREGRAALVPLPGIHRSPLSLPHITRLIPDLRFAFQEVQRYLYSDLQPRVNPVNCLLVLELANRLVLPRLVNLIEKTVIQQLRSSEQEVFIEALELLQPCQIFNAMQLSQWCLSYIGHNYNQISTKFPKLLKALTPENQALTNLTRWPPLWYVKDYEIYERFVETMATNKESLQMKKYNRSRVGCSCLSSLSSGLGTVVTPHYEPTPHWTSEE